MRRSTLTSVALLSVLGCTDASRLTSPEPEVSRATTSASLGYVAIDLGTVLDNSIALGISDAGVIVGASRSASLASSVALRWVDGVMEVLPGLDGWSDAADVDEAGRAVGFSRDGSATDHPVTWETDGTLTDLGVLEIGARVSGTNASGDVLVGFSNRCCPLWSTPIQWTDGVPEALPLPADATSARPTGINSLDHVVGAITYEVERITRPAIWSGGAPVEIPIFGLGEAINSRGLVVGSEIELDPLRFSAFSWQGGAITYLPDLGGQSAARAVNEDGLIGGVAEDAQGAFRPVLWIGGVTHELTTLGGLVGVVRDVNGHGHAVGASEDATGILRATLWRPLTPVEAIEEPISAVEDLVSSGDLNQGEGTSLTSKLLIATAMLNDGKTGPAINQLEAFINQVEAMIPDQIDPADGQALIDAAQAVIDALSA